MEYLTVKDLTLSKVFRHILFIGFVKAVNYSVYCDYSLISSEYPLLMPHELCIKIPFVIISNLRFDHVI